MIPGILARFINNENRTDYVDYSPAHTIALLDHFGNPHRSLRAIHIAGTNGKGSVAHMLHAIFAGAGYLAGLFTSPYLLEINERIIAGNTAITDSELEGYIGEIIEYADSEDSINPTFFDILTVCAFRYFRDRGVDAAIIETGLGGRLDSTNVIMPLCSLITEISLDHTALLGSSLVSIAVEKAGIIKHATPVATSRQDPRVLEILSGIAAEKGSRFYSMDGDFSALKPVTTEEGYRFDYRLSPDDGTSIRGIEISHPLAKQIDNACLAITAAIITRPLFPRLDDDSIRAGLNGLHIPGRFETLCDDPLIIFDPAHNDSAIAEMTALVRNHHPRREITVILMLMKDKNIRSILDRLMVSRLPVIYFASIDGRCYIPEATDREDVFTDTITNDEVRLHETLDRRLSPDSLFFFIGSFRLYRTALNYAGHCARNRNT